MECKHTNIISIKTNTGTECVHCLIAERDALKAKLAEKAPLRRDVPIFDVLHDDCFTDWNEDNIENARKIFGTMKYDDLPEDICERIKLYCKIVVRHEYFDSDSQTDEKIKRALIALKLENVDFGNYVCVGCGPYQKVVRADNPLVKFMETEIDGDILLRESDRRPLIDGYGSKFSQFIVIIWDFLERMLKDDKTGIVEQQIKHIFEDARKIDR